MWLVCVWIWLCLVLGVPQVAKELQAVCRQNPSKSRPSCSRASKVMAERAKAMSESEAEPTSTWEVCEVSSDSDVELLGVRSVAMEHLLPGASVHEGSSG